MHRNGPYRDRKCGIIYPSHTSKLPVLNGHKRSPTFHESSNISFNISYLGYYKNLCVWVITMCNIANSEKRTQMFKEYDIYKQYLPYFMKKNHFISSNKPF